MSSPPPPSSDDGSITDEEMIDAQYQLRQGALAQRSSAPSPPPSATSNKRARTEVPGAQYKPVQRMIGLHQWENSAQLSDVVIRFADGPGNVFHAHKVILASSSFYFRNAFLSSTWTESDSKEIVLHGDDPTALHLMLRALYLPENKYHMAEPWLDRDAVNAATVTVAKRAIFSVSVWQVADKYDCPQVKAWAAVYMTTYLNKTLEWARKNPQSPHLLPLTGLSDIVQAVYEVTAHRTLDAEPLRSQLLHALLNHPATSPYGPQTLLRTEVWRIAQAVPQFGADMFVATTRAPGYSHLVHELRIVKKVVCAACGAHGWVTSDAPKGRCDGCGVELSWEVVAVRKPSPEIRQV